MNASTQQHFFWIDIDRYTPPHTPISGFIWTPVRPSLLITPPFHDKMNTLLPHTDQSEGGGNPNTPTPLSIPNDLIRGSLQGISICGRSPKILSSAQRTAAVMGPREAIATRNAVVSFLPSLCCSGENNPRSSLNHVFTCSGKNNWRSGSANHGGEMFCACIWGLCAE